MINIAEQQQNFLVIIIDRFSHLQDYFFCLLQLIIKKLKRASYYEKLTKVYVTQHIPLFFGKSRLMATVFDQMRTQTSFAACFWSLAR